jgi:hypothetical protein
MPFDRAEHCRRIAPHGGAATALKHGVTHYRTIGKAGAAATIAKHGRAYWLGLVRRDGWDGPRRDDVITDLAYGETIKELSSG